MHNIKYEVILNEKTNEENGNKTVNNDLFDILVESITEYFLMNNK